MLLPGWTNLAADPGSVPDFGLVVDALASGRHLEYEVVTDRVPQGTEICAFGRKVAVTSRGAWCEGFHICTTYRPLQRPIHGPSQA